MLDASRQKEREALRKHVVALALYSGAEDALLEEAYKEVREPAARKVLLAIYCAARHLTEAEYYRNHGALCDEDTSAEVAQAQIQRARDNRDWCLDTFLDCLLHDVPRYIEEPLVRFAAGDVGWGSLAVDGLVDKVITVTAIRELFGNKADEGTREHDALTNPTPGVGSGV
jgi:hypothetical protein